MSGKILLAHGGGGSLTHQLIEEIILPRLANPALSVLGDGAVLGAQEGRLCVSTDASVVQPLFFPGGDIGRLAVSGTVNDLAMMGATPLALTVSLILEEGFEISSLERVLDSVASAAAEANVYVVAGDTKVVERRGGDGLMMSTAGIGVLPHGVDLSVSKIKPGDKILVSGTIADHGLAIMSAREGLAVTTQVESDVAPVSSLALALRDMGDALRFLRDPTRGGLAGVLVDVAEGAKASVDLWESALPMNHSTRHLSELLGIDPLSVANEGKLVAVVAPEAADEALLRLQALRLGKDARIIGEVVDRQPSLVELVTRVGGRRIVQRPYGEELPRIC